MKKTLIRILVACVLIAGVTGCTHTSQNPSVTRKAVASFVKAGVAIGVYEARQNGDTNTVTYLRYLAPVVCAASTGTNVQPKYITDMLAQNAQAQQFQTEAGVTIWNSAFAIYEGAYELWGAETVASLPMLQAWLGGVCDGVLGGLPPTPGSLPAVPLPRGAKKGTRSMPLEAEVPPHLTWRK